MAIAHHAASGAKALGRSATSAAQTVHSQLEILPQASSSWPGYWTFVTATIILMFILYTAQKGTLSTWIGFFAWSNPATPTAPNAASSSSMPSAPAGGGTVPGTPVGTVQPNILGLPIGPPIPGITTLSPGASGIVTTPQGNEVMNPGPQINIQSIINTVKGWL